MLKVCLDDGELLRLLTAAAEDFVRASVPQEIFRAFQKAHMTALAKKDGGARHRNRHVFQAPCRKVWHGSLPRKWKAFAHPFSLLCRHGQALIVWDMRSGP